MELIHFLLYYGPPVLYDIVKDQDYQLFCALSSCVYILLKTEIKETEINLVEDLIKGFVKGFQTLYGEQNMTLIIHQLIHLPVCVRHFGPLWCYSGFSFEDENGHLCKLIRGPKNILKQMSERISFKRNCNSIELQNNTIITTEVQKLQKCISQPRTVIEITYEKKQTCYLYGYNRSNLTTEDKEMLHVSFGNELNEQLCVEFKKMRICGLWHKNEKCKLQKTTDDSFVQLNDNSFGKIVSILLIENIVFVKIKKYQDITNGKNLPLHFNVYDSRIVESVQFYKASQIAKKGVAIYYNDDSNIYLTTMPNMFESD